MVPTVTTPNAPTSAFPQPPKAGDMVVHGRHGLMRINQIVTRQGRDYVECETTHIEPGLRISVPADTMIGLRPTLPAAEVDDVLAVLAAPPRRTNTQFARRFKTMTSHIEANDVYMLAEVARDLRRRSEDDRLAPVERDTMRRVVPMLVAELAAAAGITLEDMQERVEEALQASGGAPKRPELRIVR